MSHSFFIRAFDAFRQSVADLLSHRTRHIRVCAPFTKKKTQGYLLRGEIKLSEAAPGIYPDAADS